MRINRLFGAITLLAALGASGLAFADGPAGEGGTEMSRADMISAADSYLATMTTDVGTVATMRDDAEGDDVSRYRCIRDVWTAVNGFTAVAEQALAALRSASDSDLELINHQWGLIEVAHQRVTAGPAEARQCTGSEQFFAGSEGERSSSSDDGIPDYSVTGTGRLIDIWRRFVNEHYPEGTPFI